MPNDSLRNIEQLSAEIHKLYCIQYEKDHGESYWTGGDYSKLEERVKEYDRNIARFVTEQVALARVEERLELKERIEAYHNKLGADSIKTGRTYNIQVAEAVSYIISLLSPTPVVPEGEKLV